MALLRNDFASNEIHYPDETTLKLTDDAMLQHYRTHISVKEPEIMARCLRWLIKCKAATSLQKQHRLLPAGALRSAENTSKATRRCRAYRCAFALPAEER